MSSWIDIIEQLASDYDVTSIEFINAVSTEWASEEKRRADSLNTLNPNAGIRPLLEGDIGRMKEKVQEIVVSYVNDNQGNHIGKKIAAVIGLAYADFLDADLNTFKSSLRASSFTGEQATVEDTPARSVLEKLVTKIGRQAGVAITIAAGVAGGIIIGSRFGKK